MLFPGEERVYLCIGNSFTVMLSESQKDSAGHVETVTRRSGGAEGAEIKINY